MKNARAKDWQLIRGIRDHVPTLGEPTYAEDLVAWKRGWEELLSAELIESLRYSLQRQFPDEKYRDDRENALQTALLRFYEDTIWKYDPDKAGPTGLLAYLGKIAYHEMKKLMVRSSHDLLENDLFEITVEDPRSAHALRELVFNDWFTWLENQLKPDERDIFRLRFTDGLTFEQISAQVAKPLSTVHDTWARLCKRAATTLELELGGDEHGGV